MEHSDKARGGWSPPIPSSSCQIPALGVPWPRQLPAAPHPVLPIEPSSALQLYLQGMVYGSAVGDQLIECGSIEMLSEGHQSYQLVCRNLGQRDKNSVTRLAPVPI